MLDAPLYFYQCLPGEIHLKVPLFQVNLLNQLCLSNPFFLADSSDIGPYIRILIIFNYIHSSTLNIWTDFSPFCH